MASNSEACGTTYVDSSSDDECLLTLKRKADSINEENGKKSAYGLDSDDEPIMAGVLVTVEVEEMDDDSPLEFNKEVKTEKPKKAKKRKKIKKHKAPKPVIKCNECDMEFETYVMLKKHSSEEHPIQTRHKCEICNRYFKKAFCLRMHEKVHTGRSGPECKLCGIKFSERSYLLLHMASHERTVECNDCHLKFHLKSQLQNHRKQAHSRRIKAKLKEQELKAANKRQQNANKRKAESEASNMQSDQDLKSETYDEDYGRTHFLFDEYRGNLKREDLSDSTQCAIVNKMHKGRSIPDICRLYNLKPEVVNEIWEDREKYPVPKKVAKSTTTYLNNTLDAKILEWFQNQKDNDVQVSGQMVQDIAEAFAKESGFVAFNGSRKWLDRFKKRYNITFRGIRNKRDYNNHLESKWKNHFFKEQWIDARLGISDEDIYTADEFGFYYNASKGRIKKLSGKKFIQGHAKDRLAVFLCANMPGTDKKKLLVCGTEDPLIHSHRNPDTLPVTYIRHPEAHFTTPMFEEYVKYWNRELAASNRKAILVLDRATIHSKLQLSHLKLVFVPWKATNGLMPMKNGVFVKFRDEFRRLILEEKAMNAVRGVDRNMTCLEAFYMLEKAWDRVPPEVINKSFIATGYDVTVTEVNSETVKPKVYDNDEERLAHLLKDYEIESYYTNMPHLEQYLTVDEELVTGQGTNGSVFGGNHKVTEPLPSPEKQKEDILPLATEKPHSGEKENLVRKSRALQDLDIIKKYLQTNETSYETFRCFMEVENAVMKTVVGSD